MKIKRGDMVEVITGDDAVKRENGKGTARKVLQIVAGGKKVLIEGVNRVYKHVKRGHPKSPQGGRLSREMPIDISNVQLYCNSCGRGVRVGYKLTAEGAKIRVCRRCDADLGTVTPPKAGGGGGFPLRMGKPVSLHVKRSETVSHTGRIRRLRQAGGKLK
jgi:large subunit ribosomal protein L24